jgi:beta-galactosidase
VFAEVQALGLNSKSNLPLATMKYAPTAIIFDYTSIWMAQIQPQGADFNAIEIAFRAYSAMRSLGLDVDIVSSHADLSAYQLVVLPAHMREDAALAQRLQDSGAQVVFGPRSGAKGQTLSFSDNLPPGAFGGLAGVQVQRVSSLPPGLTDTARWPQTDTFEVSRWREDLVLTGASAVATFDDGKPAVTRYGSTWYSAGWPSEAGWLQLLTRASQAAGLAPVTLPADVRISRNGDLAFVQNFSSSTVKFSPSTHVHCLLGARELAPQGLAIWKLSPSA